MGRKSNSEEMVGKILGNIEVLGRVYNEKRKEWEFRCRCYGCMREFIVRKDHLLKPRNGCRSCSNKIAAQRIKEKKYKIS